MDSSYEFDPTPPGWWVRVATTPLSDALRGRFSGHYDARQEIAACGLPSPVAGIIYAIVQKTRLWRSEKLDVARELINHFSDGLATARTPEELIADFGSAKQAARLIRQAKLRQRPTAWQAWWYASRAFTATVTILAIAYGLLAARFLTTHPNINRNYWEDINAARTVPESERAWPLYREALLAIKLDDRNLLVNLPDMNELLALRGSGLVERNQNSLDLTRQAAHRPAMGYLIGNPEDRAAALAVGESNLFRSGPLAADNAPLIEMNGDGPHGLRKLAHLLTLDAWDAAEAGRGDRVVENIRTMLAMSAHTFQPRSTLYEQLIGTSLFSSAVDTLGLILRDYPDILSDEQLRALAHALAGYRDGRIELDFHGEWAYYYDELQRIYSDDGQGDGRVTPEGMRELNSLTWQPESDFDVPIVHPGWAVLMASRADAERFYREAMERSLAVRQGPPWTWDYEAVREADNQYDLGLKPPLDRIRHSLMSALSPAISPVRDVAERTTLQRDAAETAIALVLWHRRHGSWPERLDQLVPELLPALPLDRYDGQPLRYVVRDGRPVLYSIGDDRRDDGGRPTRPPKNAMGRFGPVAPGFEINPPSMDPDSSSVSDFDGDWILWPPLPPEKPAAVDEDSTATETTPAP